MQASELKDGKKMGLEFENEMDLGKFKNDR